jgi:hypothetical protein
MFRGKKSLGAQIFYIVLFLIFIAGIPFTHAQYWEALPPYNILWPLWSPLLSPINPMGDPIPLLTSLDQTTVLPLQPVLVWDPAQQYPWLLYNMPDIFGGNLIYFDTFYGLNVFPPPYLLDGVGLPLPIALPLGFEALPPTGLTEFAPYISIANYMFSDIYNVGLLTLLTAADIWGLSPSGLPIL